MPIHVGNPKEKLPAWFKMYALSNGHCISIVYERHWACAVAVGTLMHISTRLQPNFSVYILCVLRCVHNFKTEPLSFRKSILSHLCTERYRKNKVITAMNLCGTSHRQSQAYGRVHSYLTIWAGNT